VFDCRWPVVDEMLRCVEEAEGVEIALTVNGKKRKAIIGIEPHRFVLYFLVVLKYFFFHLSVSQRLLADELALKVIFLLTILLFLFLLLIYFSEASVCRSWR
jgi:hypothetical protein